MDFSVPGGFPNNPENPMSAISNWWDSMPQAGIGRGSGESVPEGEWKP
jgi:hypothetical protein